MRAFSSKSRSVQRECPSGTGAQAIWIMRASGASVHFTECSAGIRADIVADNILYAIPDIRLDDICYGGRRSEEHTSELQSQR